MKSFKLLLLFFLGTVLMTTMSCTKDSCTTTVTYKKYSPIYKTLDEMNQPVQIPESKEIKETGVLGSRFLEKTDYHSTFMRKLGNRV
ncbi:MAG TPA: hypothetical protein ENK85_05130, partial [Saprospiraceae bacterium]|nr:hypothetical protein [Saprospiraceae bacterium]